ncbi:hypothetical protein D3C76_1082700 [compost metagenome]
MAFLLFAQLGGQRRAAGLQLAQLGFLRRPLGGPAALGLRQALALVPAQLDFATQRGGLGRQVGMPRGEALAGIALGIQLGAEAVLGQLGGGQAFLAQRQFLFAGRHALLQVPGERRQRHGAGQQSEQQVGQIDRHSALRGRDWLAAGQGMTSQSLPAHCHAGKQALGTIHRSCG